MSGIWFLTSDTSVRESFLCLVYDIWITDIECALEVNWF
jgi:hypothetical protein